MTRNFLRAQRESFILSTATLLTSLAASASGAIIESRNIDGSGNNVANPQWGAANTQLIRISSVAYPGDMSGSTILEPPDRPNPRDISNTVVSQGFLDMPNGHLMSSIVWQWGQFLDHDISLTDSSSANGTADIPILDPADPLGPSPIPFSRSNYDPTTGDSAANPRQQINQLTAYIDASNVYGSDSVRADGLRTFSGGKLATSAGNLLPLNVDGLPNGGGPDPNLFVAGDIRANEQVGLTAMHTLFVREHNRLADLLAVEMPGADDDAIYQTARKIVGAEMQAITYNSFLPALLGSWAPKAEDYFYDPSLDPSIANEFSTALYRFGHTMLPKELMLVNDDGTQVGALPLRDAFFNPSFLQDDPARLDQVIKGLMMQQAQEVDGRVVDDVRSFLFGPPGAGGMDLASLNIQRGRDHGLPDYNSVRVAYGLDPATNFSDITSDPTLQALLASEYSSVDQVDLWLGGLLEDHLPGAAVGELIATALIDQFSRLRDGDRFFYMADPDLLSEDVLNVIDLSKITLGDIVRFNTGITQIQHDMFFMPEPSSMALALIGVVGLAFAARRRRR